VSSEQAEQVLVVETGEIPNDEKIEWEPLLWLGILKLLLLLLWYVIERIWWIFGCMPRVFILCVR
jgi:hypothetical protein